MNSLDKIVKLIINADKYFTVAMILEIASNAGQALFRCKQARLAF